MKFKFILALTAICAASAMAQSKPPGFDIAGIRFGMSPAEVRAAMKAYDSKMKIEDFAKYRGSDNGTPSSLASITGKGSDKSIGDFFVEFGQFDQKLYRIERKSVKMTSMRQSTLNESLLNKYKFNIKDISAYTPTNSTNWWEWAYKPDGTFEVGKPSTSDDPMFKGRKTYECPMPSDHTARKGCGVTVELHMMSATRSGVELNENFEITALDHSIMYDNGKKSNDASAAFELAKKRGMEEKSKSVSPKL